MGLMCHWWAVVEVVVVGEEVEVEQCSLGVEEVEEARSGPLMWRDEPMCHHDLIHGCLNRRSYHIRGCNHRSSPLSWEVYGSGRPS